MVLQFVLQFHYRGMCTNAQQLLHSKMLRCLSVLNDEAHVETGDDHGAVANYIWNVDPCGEWARNAIGYCLRGNIKGIIEQNNLYHDTKFGLRRGRIQ